MKKRKKKTKVYVEPYYDVDLEKKSNSESDLFVIGFFWLMFLIGNLISKSLFIRFLIYIFGSIFVIMFMNYIYEMRDKKLGLK